MLAKLMFLVVVLVLCAKSNAQDGEFLGDSEALEFLDNDENGLMKRFLYSGQEQRREVRERYEEKCERSFIHKSRARWCPELDTWPDWVAVSKNDPKHKKLSIKNIIG